MKRKHEAERIADDPNCGLIQSIRNPQSAIRNQARARAAFSLIELLVVVSIMSLLIAVAFVVIGDSFGTAKRQATVATIKKVDELLTTRMDAFTRWLQIQGDANLALAGNERGLAGSNQELALVLGRKEYFRHYFPQMFTESTTAISGGPTHTPVTESSECLYFFLTNAEAFGAEPIGEDAFSTAEKADTDGDGLMELVDGWNRPLRFYRWPTRLLRPTMAEEYPAAPVGTFGALLFGTTSLFTGMPMEAQNDPDDAIGLIDVAVTTMPTPPFSAQDFEDNYHSAGTYHAPLIVSAGPDGLIGLYEPNDVTNRGHLGAPLPDADGNPTKTTVEELTDNITNLNQRAGTGKKQ